MRMSWRLASRLSVITLALLVVVIVAFWGARHGNGTPSVSANSNSSALQGTDMGGQIAPDFHLTDQSGKPVSLSQFRGKLVVLTFLYTHCPDACPLTAEKLHTSQLQLGKDVSQVVMLAVSTDPKGDTQASALNFSQAHKLTSNWHYLVGSHEQLAPVWSGYSVYAQSAAASNKVTHSSALYIIDTEGRERIFFGDDFTSTQLTNDLKALLQN